MWADRAIADLCERAGVWNEHAEHRAFDEWAAAATEAEQMEFAKGVLESLKQRRSRAA